MNPGLPDIQVLYIAIDPITPSTLYAATDQKGVFKSTDGGGNWSAMNTALPDVYYLGIRNLTIDPITPSTVYAGTTDSVYKYETVSNGGSSGGSSSGGGGGGGCFIDTLVHGSRGAR
jgi:uncharacterized membrane protein YgcG